jgi:hypothetical protein
MRLFISQGKFPAACGVQLVAAIRWMAVRRRADGGHLKIPRCLRRGSLFLSLCAGAMTFGVASAQTTAGGGNAPQIPYGQTFKDFQFPLYQNGQLSAMLSAVSAKGTTLNRAETTDLKIQVYESGKVATTITSPKADLYLAERIMRTKNTVQIERSDIEATAQSCDFNLQTKKYLLRDNVKVTLKNFDATLHAPGASAPSTSSRNETRPPAPVSVPAPVTDSSLASPPLSLAPAPPSRNSASLLDSPGAYSSGTNVAPTQPARSVTP